LSCLVSSVFSKCLPPDVEACLPRECLLVLFSFTQIVSLTGLCFVSDTTSLRSFLLPTSLSHFLSPFSENFLSLGSMDDSLSSPSAGFFVRLHLPPPEFPFSSSFIPQVCIKKQTNGRFRRPFLSRGCILLFFSMFLLPSRLLPAVAQERSVETPGSLFAILEASPPLFLILLGLGCHLSNLELRLGLPFS